jgi:Protein of unknown function DUF72
MLPSRVLSTCQGFTVMAGRIYVGTAGWSIPRASAHRYPPGGTHLERYARVFPCAEINSSFSQSHSPTTYARWAVSAPRDFRFAVKLPGLITHEYRLPRSRAPLDRFLGETTALGCRRGPLLVQLPPSFAFETRAAARFFEMVGRPCHYTGIYYSGRLERCRVLSPARRSPTVPVAVRLPTCRGLARSFGRLPRRSTCGVCSITLRAGRRSKTHGNCGSF